MKIGIVIVTHNRSEYLESCVSALSDQIGKDDQIIIIDNNSPTEGSSKNKQIVSDISNKNVRYVWCATNSIPSGRNKGIQILLPYVDGIAFIDDDCVVADNWVHLTKCQHNLNNQVDVLQGGVNHSPKDNFYIRLTAEMYRNWLESNRTGNVMRTFDSKNVSFKVSVFQDKRNRFDERLRYSSDIEFGQRLCRQGLLIRYESSIAVYHNERDSFFPFIKQHMNIAIGEKDVGVGLVPDRYKYHVQSIVQLAKQFISRGDVLSLIKLCVVIPLLLIIRSMQFIN